MIFLLTYTKNKNPIVLINQHIYNNKSFISFFFLFVLSYYCYYLFVNHRDSGLLIKLIKYDDNRLC